VVLARTNRPTSSSALLLPGRFDRHITVNAPDRKGSAAILRCAHPQGAACRRRGSSRQSRPRRRA